MNIKSISWNCPKCESSLLVEVCVNCVMRARLSGQLNDSSLLFDVQESINPGVIDHYECGVCGHVVLDQGRIISSREHMSSLLVAQPAG